MNVHEETQSELKATNEEVDNALDFGVMFDDIQGELRDNTLPTLRLGPGSLGTCSPSPSFDDQSLTSTGSKRSRHEFHDETTDDEQSSKRMMSRDMRRWTRGGGATDTTLSAIRLDREREGRCPDCGLETHAIVQSETGYDKTPLNVEGEVLDGRCMFCHPLEDWEIENDTKKSDTHVTNEGNPGQTDNLSRLDSSMSTPQVQNRKSPMRTSQPTPVQYRKSPKRKQGTSETTHDQDRSWEEHVTINTGKDAASVEGDDVSRCSQYSRSSQVSDGMSRLGKAMATGMGLNSAYTPKNQVQSLHPQRHSAEMHNRVSSTASSIGQSPNSGNVSNGNYTSPLGGSDGRNIPAHVRLAHNKLPSSIYHHHLYPMSKETEQAYIEKTLAYLESGGGDIVDIIAAMRRFPFSLPIQSLCCEKLYVHCFDDNHAHAIVLVGGIQSILDAMEHHSKDVALQRGCAGIIKNMATASKDNLDMLERMGAVRAILNTMEKNKTCSPLLESCCWALATMASGPNLNLKFNIAKSGGLHAAMSAVERFPQNESLLRAAFHCLQQLGYNPSSYVEKQHMQNQSQQQRQPLQER